MTHSTLDWDALESGIAGDVVLPDASGYERLRKPAIARFHELRPQAIVRCSTPEDVSQAISFASGSGLEVAIRSGGHCLAGHSSTRGTLIDVAPLNDVSVSGSEATVGSGARLGDVYDALATHGRTVAAGCGPDVGISGLTLGGGVGILGRKYGLTSDQLVAAQVVLADGRVVECNNGEHEDLFWALRGAGGGNFGVVTSLVLRTVPEPDATVFSLLWPYADAVPVVEAWQAWAPAATDELAASMLVTASGDDQAPVVNVFGAMLGTESDTAALLDELVLRAGVDPTSAMYTHTTYGDAKHLLARLGDQLHGQESEDGHPFSKSEFFRRSLPSDVVVELVANLTSGLTPGQFRELDFTPWGGAYNRVPADATAFVHRDEQFLLKQAVTVNPLTGSRQDAQRWLARSWATTHPWGTGGAYQNFPDSDLDDWADAYYGPAYPRLQRVKARYDPGQFFRFHQSVTTG